MCKNYNFLYIELLQSSLSLWTTNHGKIIKLTRYTGTPFIDMDGHGE